MYRRCLGVLTVLVGVPLWALLLPKDAAAALRWFSDFRLMPVTAVLQPIIARANAFQRRALKAREARAAEATGAARARTTSDFCNGSNCSQKPMYAVNDSWRFAEWSRRLQGSHRGVPRVLIYTWHSEDMFERFLNENYWKSCYAHAHGFDFVISDEYAFRYATEGNKVPWPMDRHRDEDWEAATWAWVYGVKHSLLSGKWDYVFMMSQDSLIQPNNLDFPVWAWDRGHDITIMDQYNFPWPNTAYGLDTSGILFKNTQYTQDFLKHWYDYRGGPHVLGAAGPFMETVLIFLGRQVKAIGRPDYTGRCKRFLTVGYKYGLRARRRDPEKYDKYMLLAEHYSHCFFRELERLVGRFGFRATFNIGFSPTFISRDGKKQIPFQVQVQDKIKILSPWANCWHNIWKNWPYPEMNCFAIRVHSPDSEILQEHERFSNLPTVRGECPDPSFSFSDSPHNPKNRKKLIPLHTAMVRNEWTMYRYGDFHLLGDWARRYKHSSRTKPPRVLIYTWCTEDSYTKFENEVYWKACYAHSHQFDVVFSSAESISGEQGNSEGGIGAWVDDIQKYLFSGKYDYVFMMRAEVLIQESNFDFPVWAYDRGSDITVMDQHFFDDFKAVGLDANNILFKPSNFTRNFLQELLKYRRGFHLHGEHGPYMETILLFLGRESKKQGRSDYDGACSQYLKLDEPEIKLKMESKSKWIGLTELYSKCFFDHLDSLVGIWGERNAGHFGFSPIYVPFNGSQLLPSSFHGNVTLGPWANCLDAVRKFWSLPSVNCFAYHWSDDSDPSIGGAVKGTCPDPTFEWPNSKYDLVK